MTKKIEETFGLPPLDEVLVKNEENEMNEIDEDASKELVETSENIGIMANVKEDEHDHEAEDVRVKAVQAFEDIMIVGRNVNPERSARLFEVAGQFLKIGLDAANSKSEKQLKAAKLKIEAIRLKISDEMVHQINNGREVMADRNELLKQMMSENKKNVVDATIKNDSSEN